MDDKIKNCPFCASPGVVIDTVMGDWTKDGYGPNGSRVVCEDMSCPVSGRVFYGDNQRREAIESWNIRRGERNE